jgi:hypothetical protein
LDSEPDFLSQEKLNRKDYGMVYNDLIEAGGAVVSDEIKLDLHVGLHPASITKILTRISTAVCVVTINKTKNMDNWLNSLQTATPQEGFELAIKLARMGVKYTQPDMEVLKAGRKEYAGNAEFLINASQVIAIHYQTIAKANNYWKD